MNGTTLLILAVVGYLVIKQQAAGSTATGEGLAALSQGLSSLGTSLQKGLQSIAGQKSSGSSAPASASTAPGSALSSGIDLGDLVGETPAQTAYLGSVVGQNDEVSDSSLTDTDLSSDLADEIGSAQPTDSLDLGDFSQDPVLTGDSGITSDGIDPSLAGLQTDDTDTSDDDDIALLDDDDIDDLNSDEGGAEDGFDSDDITDELNTDYFC
jgi:hypothetical protein